METQTKATARAGAAAEENAHVDRALNVHSTTGREALLNRLCLDGGHTAAFALRALHRESPRLAGPILEHFARMTDEVDGLLLSLGDAAVREAA